MVGRWKKSIEEIVRFKGDMSFSFFFGGGGGGRGNIQCHPKKLCWYHFLAFFWDAFGLTSDNSLNGIVILYHPGWQKNIMHGLHYLDGGSSRKMLVRHGMLSQKRCRNPGSLHQLVHWYLLKEHQIPWDAPPQVESNHKVTWLYVGDSGETGCNAVIGWWKTTNCKHLLKI